MDRNGFARMEAGKCDLQELCKPVNFSLNVQSLWAASSFVACGNGSFIAQSLEITKMMFRQMLLTF